MSDPHFFARLPVHRGSLSAFLGREEGFAPVPPDWHVVVTDIKNSTRAHQAGRHEEVNLVAAGSIISTLNLSRRSDLQIPFFFGGDGATMIVPEDLLSPVLGALYTHRQQTHTNFDLDLRVGAIPVADLYDAGHSLRIGRHSLNEVHLIPVLLGDGLAEAERRVKSADGPAETNETAELDLTGMECRWDRVEPADQAHEVVCLLANAAPGQSQGSVFRQVIELLDRIYGPPDARNPISTQRLHLDPSFRKITLETKTRLGRMDLPYLLRNWVITQGSRLFFFSRPSGQQYARQLVALTDTLVIDGRINTVIAGTPAQRETLDRVLGSLEAEGLLVYGLFVSRESIMSCYVTDRSDQHIHFVDGSDGGYTMAASVLKRKSRAAAT
jgi:hypothetical protein